MTAGKRGAACEDFPDEERDADDAADADDASGADGRRRAEQSSVSSIAVEIETGVRRRRVTPIDEEDVNIAELNSPMTKRRSRGGARGRALKQLATSSTKYSLDGLVIRSGGVVAEGRGEGDSLRDESYSTSR